MRKTIKYVFNLFGDKTATAVAKFQPRKGVWVIVTRYSGEALPREALTCHGFNPDLFLARGPGWPGVTGRTTRAALVRTSRWPGDKEGEVPPKSWCA